MPIQVSPTIFIGLGGTGCRICTHLERRIHASPLPLQVKKRLAVIGIDSRRTPDVGVEVSNYYGLSVIRLAEDVKRLISSLRQLPNEEQDAKFFAEWYGSKDRSGNVGSFVDGCGQDRVNGRLLFQSFMRYYAGDQGVPRLKGHLLQLRRGMVVNPDEMEVIEVLEDGVHVVLVTGAAGGTGSGLLLDIAYLVRSVFHEEGAEGGGIGLGRLSGIVLTDQVTVADKTLGLDQAYKNSQRKNTIGCLAEIDFWGQPAVTGNPDLDYAAHWNTYAPQEQVAGGSPPFDDCIILESTTDTGRGPRTAAHSYRFVADFLADFYTDPNLLKDFRSDLSNFDTQINEWLKSRPMAVESPHFKRIGRFKLVVPLEAIKNHLEAEIVKDALEAGFEHRHSNSEDDKRFVESTISQFKDEHFFTRLNDLLMLIKPDHADYPRRAPNYASTLAEIGDYDTFRKAIDKRVGAIQRQFESEILTKEESLIQCLVESLESRWLHGFSNFEKKYRDRISARNIVCFLEEVKSYLDEKRKALDTEAPALVQTVVPDERLKRWKKDFSSWALTAARRAKVSKSDAAKWLEGLWNDTHDFHNWQAKVRYVERSVRVIGNLLSQAQAITDLMVGTNRFKSTMVTNAARAAQAMAEDSHAMRHVLISRPEDLEGYIPDWIGSEGRKAKVKSIYHRWVSGDYDYQENVAAKSDNQVAVTRTYWDDTPQGVVGLLWSMVSHREKNDVLEAPLGETPAELEAMRKAQLTAFQTQIQQTAHRILDHEWKFDKLGERLTAWKVLLNFTPPPPKQLDFLKAFKDRLLEMVKMAGCLSPYREDLGYEGKRANAAPIMRTVCLYNQQSAHDAALEALQPYDPHVAITGPVAFDTLVPDSIAVAKPSCTVEPTEIVILNIQGRCFLRNFSSAGEDVESTFASPAAYPRWLDCRFPDWVKTRDKSLPEPDEEVQRRRLRCALAWAWRQRGTGLVWSRDKGGNGDSFYVNTQLFEDFHGLFDILPNDRRAWKTITDNLSGIWDKIAPVNRRQPLEQAREELLKLAAARRDTLKVKRQTLIKAAAETVARLLDSSDDYLKKFEL